MRRDERRQRKNEMIEGKERRRGKNAKREGEERRQRERKKRWHLPEGIET